MTLGILKMKGEAHGAKLPPGQGRAPCVVMDAELIFLPQSLYLRRRRQSLKTMCSDSCIEILM